MGLLGRVGDSEAEGRNHTVVISTGQRKKTLTSPLGPLGVVGTEEKAPFPSPVFLRTQVSTGLAKQGRYEES